MKLKTIIDNLIVILVILSPFAFIWLVDLLSPWIIFLIVIFGLEPVCTIFFEYLCVPTGGGDCEQE